MREVDRDIYWRKTVCCCGGLQGCSIFNSSCSLCRIISSVPKCQANIGKWQSRGRQFVCFYILCSSVWLYGCIYDPVMALHAMLRLCGGLLWSWICNSWPFLSYEASDSMPGGRNFNTICERLIYGIGRLGDMVYYEYAAIAWDCARDPNQII